MIALLALAVTQLTPMNSALAGVLMVMYAEQSPFTVTMGRGHVGGVVGIRATDILERAGITANWVLMPAERHLKIIKSNRQPVCAVGWNKTSARSKYGVFSKNFHKDKPTIGLVRANNEKALRHNTLASLLADKTLIFGAEYGHSYGKVIDAQIKQFTPKTVKTAQDSNGLFLMMMARRYDYILILGDAFKTTIDETNIPPSDVAKVEFPDLPMGKHRAFMCSQSVSAEIIDALNSSIID